MRDDMVVRTALAAAAEALDAEGYAVLSSDLKKADEAMERIMDSWQIKKDLLSSSAVRIVQLVRERDGERIRADQFRLRAGNAEADAAQLRSEIEDYFLWQPGRAGHAAAARRLLDAIGWKKEGEPLTGFQPAQAGLAAARPESKLVLPSDSARDSTAPSPRSDA